jgi:heat shock protein HslJ
MSFTSITLAASALGVAVKTAPMTARPLLLLALLATASACATAQSSSTLPVGVAFQLAEVDGEPAGKRSFRLRFDGNNSYTASYACNDHFGSYSFSERLRLAPGPSTILACDEIDISSGRPVVYDPRLANQFFSDPVFSVTSRRGSLELRNRRHTFTFVPRQ